MATPATKSWRITPTSAGIIKSRYPAGDDTAEPPTWATIPDFTQKSSAFSVDISQYLSGAYSSITLTTVSGSLAGTGWSFASPFLAYSGAGSGLLTVRFRAIGASTANSNVLTIESIIVLSADTYSPALVTGLAASLNASNKPVLSWRPTSDPAPPGVAWSGLKDYQLYRDSGLLTTITSAVGLQYGMTPANIGTPSLGGTAVQTGSSVTLSGNGAAFGATADSGQFYGASVSGDFFASCKVTAFTSISTVSKLMITARTSLNAASTHVSATCRPLVSGALSLEYRGTAGATAIPSQLGGPTGAFWLGFARAGNVWTQVYSSDGLAWSTLTTVSITLPTAVLVGLALSANQLGVTANATVTDWNITQAASLTYTDTTAADGTTYVYSVLARDTSLNTSAGAALPVTTSPPISSTANRILHQTFGGLAFANRVTGATNVWADFVGTDSGSGQIYPITQALWGGTTPVIPSLQCIGLDPVNDQTRILVSGTGPLGTTETFLRLGLAAPYNSTVTTQNYFVWYAANGTSFPSGMIYIRRWLRLSGNFAANMANGKFFSICETKTTPSTGRINVQINSYSGTPSWVVGSEYYAGGVTYTNFFNDVLPAATYPVPAANAWFLLEAAWRYTASSSGWAWMAHNGAQVYYRSGQNQPTPIASEKINRIYPWGLYSNMSRSLPFTVDHSRVEIWNAWPADAAPHPNVS